MDRRRADHRRRCPAPGDRRGVAEILVYRHQVFIAIDYAEGLGGTLSEFLSQIPGPDTGIVRVLVLARFGGRWWTSILPSGEIKYHIDRDPIQLEPLGSRPELAADRFSEAIQDYRPRIRGPGVDPGSDVAVPAGLAVAARRYSSAIELHALALVSVLHERDHRVLPTEEMVWTDPLTMLVAHERKHWQKAALGRLSRAYGEPWDGRILLVPTLLPVYREGDSAAAISRIPGLADRYSGNPADIAALLRDLYPPDELSLRWWSPLPLDRLGETLLAEVLEDSLDADLAAEYVSALLGGADLPQAVPGLTLMVWLGADPQTSGVLAERIRRCLDTLAVAGRSRLLPALLQADRHVPAGHRTSERQLASLNVADTFTLVQNLVRTSGHRLLQETGLVLLDHADQMLDSGEETAQAFGIDVPTATLAQIHAEALRAQLLLELGRAGEAIGPAESAARMMRAVFRATAIPGDMPRFFAGRDRNIVIAAGPSDQSESLLDVLDVYAKALKDVGRLRESAQVRQECAPVAVRMAESDDPHAKYAAGFCLYQLAETLLELGEADQAERWARAAVEVARALPASPLMAGTLTVWARALDRIGTRAEARATAAEALGVHREIAAATGSRVHLTVAALSLRHLLPEEAGVADPLAELRAEAVSDPALATPVFVGVALQRVRDLAAQGQREDAGQQMAEALVQARRLAADDPDTYLDSVAAALMESAQLGLSDDPQEALSEAAGILRQLARDRGDVSSRVGLALALEQYAVRLRSAGRLEEALQGFTEAIGLLRSSLAQDRWQAAMYLSNVLGLFSETIRARDPEQAVAAAREAIDLEVARTDDHAPAPAERLLLLRRMLFVALAQLMGTQARQGADDTVMTAIAREIRELGGSFPAATLDAHDIAIYAGALNVIGELLRNSGSLERALAPFGEAARVLRKHATSNPAWDNTGMLLTTGLSCVAVYQALGRHGEAARAMTETLADCRRPLPGGEQERLACVPIAGAVIDHLPEPEFTVERLQLAVEMSRTCRALPQDLAEGEGGTAASALVIFRFLKGVVGTGLLDDGTAAAALEISAGIRFLAEHSPGLLEAEHAEALSFAASTLSASDLEQALDLSTRAMGLYRSLPAGPGGEPMRPHTASLVVHGMVLFRTGRYENAVQPLEQALPDLLAAGPRISADQLRFLNMAVSLLSQAYRVLRRDDAIQAVAAAVEAAGIPDVVSGTSAWPRAGRRSVHRAPYRREYRNTDPHAV